MLPGDQLPAANSLNLTVFQFGAIVGPLLAGVMLRWVDLSTLYLIDAITCIAPIWATFRLAPMPPTNGGQGSSGYGFDRGARRLPLPGGQQGGADVVRRRPDRDDPRHAARAVPADGTRELRRAGRGRHHDGAAGGRDVGGRRRRRGVLRLAPAHPAPGPGRRRRDRGVGRGDDRLRRRRRAGARPRRAMLWIALAFLAVGGAADMVSAAFRSTILQQAASDDCAAGCRACSPSSSPAGPGWPTRCTAPPRRRSAPRSPPRAVADWWWSAWWSPRWLCLRSSATGWPSGPTKV